MHFTDPFDAVFNEPNQPYASATQGDSPFATAREAAQRTRLKELRPNISRNYKAETLVEYGITDSTQQQEVQKTLPLIRRFALDCQDAELSNTSALILQQAIENYQVNRLTQIEATALNKEKAQFSGKDAEHSQLAKSVADKRSKHANSMLPHLIDNAKAREDYAFIQSMEDKEKNIPPIKIATRSYKRALTERNDALHYARTDLPEIAAPLVTPVELEKITAAARETVKQQTQYVLHDHYLSVITEDTNLPSNWASDVAGEVTKLQQRLTTPVVAHNDNGTHVTLALNLNEAELLCKLAGNQDIRTEQERAKIVGPDHNPLTLVTLSAEGFERLSKNFGPIPSKHR